MSGHFFKAVVQAVLLFGAQTWVLTPRMERALSIFQHMIAQQLTGRQPMRWGGWDLVLPSAGGGNSGSGLQGEQDLHHEEAE